MEDRLPIAPRALAAILLLAACAAPPHGGPGGRPPRAEAPRPPLILGAPRFLPGGVPGESLAEAAVAPLPASDRFEMETGTEADIYARFCAEPKAAAAALATRHPTPEETAACATKGIALTSVQIASYAGKAKGADAPQGAFLVYDARDDRPEARALIERIDKNRVALFGLPGYAELFVAHG